MTAVDTLTVCLHFQFGFQFGESCRKRHEKKICDVSNCDRKCINRHPKSCRYYTFYGVFKYKFFIPQ